MTFKPMLASPIEDTSTLKFPVLASIKLDGIRATVQSGVLLSRNLKPLPNKNIQKKFSKLPEGFDGELIFGDPAEELAFSKTTSIVMSDSSLADGVNFHVFDIFNDKPFKERDDEVFDLLFHQPDYVMYVNQKKINNEEELLAFEAAALEAGHEGIMVRSLDGPYKQGRSSVKQGYLLKLKRFKDGEAKILGFVEEQENTNEAKTNALGRTERSSKKEGMVGKGTLGKFEVVGINGPYKDVEFSVGGGFTAVMRQEYWTNRKKLVGKIVKYKYFPTGSVERPRFPVFLGFRDKRDM
jgi:DNA ligase-1